MDLKSFIESGLLESYVLGQCTADERALVEQMASEHPSVRSELLAVETTLENYAQTFAVKPPDGLKDKILQAIDDIKPAGPSGPSSDMLRPSFIIAIALALASIVLAFQYFSLRAANAEQNKEIAALQQQLEDCSRRSEREQNVAKLLRDQDTKTIQMTDGKSYLVTVFSNKVRRETYLDLSGLGAPPPGKFLQAWAIVGGKPVSLGMVEMQSAGGWQSLPYTDNAEAFAISAEDKPTGNPSPTMVLMVGKT